MFSDVRLGSLQWRNRLLADPRFQRFAARFWLTRPIARRRARALFDLVAGFTYSQILSAAVRTGLVDELAEEPRDVATLAPRIALDAAATERLLRAAAALGLTEQVGTRWTLGRHGAALRGNRGIAEMVLHHEHLYHDLADPIALLQRGGGGGALARYWHYAGAAGSGNAVEVASYSALMAASQAMIAEQVLDAYPVTRHQRLLDVGGGEGAFLLATAARAPGLSLSLFDLPSVVARAQARFAEAGLDHRLTVTGGDFLQDPLPPGHDLITLVRVLHDHNDGPALTLLRAIHRALPSHGRLLIAEPMAATASAEPAGDAYFGMYLLAMGSGRPRTAEEIAKLLRMAGFTSIREHSTIMPLTCRAVSACHL